MKSLEQFAEEFKKDLRIFLKNQPKKDVDEYISNLDKAIEDDYNYHVSNPKLRDSCSPNGLVWDCAMLYPDYP